MKNNYKLALLSGPLFSNNMGCNALTYGSLVILSEVAKKLNTAFEYYLVGNSTTGIIPRELGGHTISFLEHLPDLSVKGMLRCLYRHTFQEEKRQAGILGNADIFLDNAWGDSFSDIYGQGRFDTVLEHFTFALKRGKPLILLPQTIGPFRNERVQEQARAILKSVSAIYARDPLSARCAKELAPEQEVFETVDAACFMPYQKRHTSHRKGLIVGINPSGLLWKGGYTGTNQFGLKEEYTTVIRNIIRELLLLEDISIELIGHDISGPNAGDIGEDYYICKTLQTEFPQCNVAPFFYSPVEAKSYISGLDLLIGSRMHCCIAAYSSGVPVYPLAYSRKFTGLFKEKLDYPFLSDLTEDNDKGIVCGLQNVLGGLVGIKAQMPDRYKILEQYKKELIEHLSSKMGNLL